MKWVLAALLALLAACASSSVMAASAMVGGARYGGHGGMKILYISSDDTPKKFHSAFGADSLNQAMPNIDSLAAQGVTFPKMMAAPQCTPDRVTLMTSRFTFRTGVYGATYDATAEPQLPRRFRAAVPKAWTFAVGKMGGIAEAGSEALYDAVGFDRIVGRNGNLISTYNGGSGFRYDSAATPRYAEDVVWAAGTHMTQYEVNEFQSLLGEYRASHSNHPFFAWMTFNAVHFQQPNPDEFHDPSAGAPWSTCPLATLADCLKAMTSDSPLGLDWAVGQVLDALTWEEKSNLCIFYSPDNGGEGGYMPEYVLGRAKGYPGYQGSNTGMIVAGSCVPRTNWGTSADAGVSVADVGPTIADLVGFELEPGWTRDGVSFASLLTADCGAGACDTAPSGREYNFYQAALDSGISGQYYGVAYEDGSYSLMFSADASTTSLYTPNSDPLEATDKCAGNCSSVTTLTAPEETACQNLVDYAHSTLGVMTGTIDCNSGI